MEVGMPDVILRWLQYMSTFDVTVEYRAGKQHGNADGLSRPPHEEDCVARGCVCRMAAANVESAEDLEDDGEPDFESHPAIAPVESRLIAAVTRSGKNTAATTKSARVTKAAA